MSEKNGFFLVIGDKISKDGSNIIQYIETDIIPEVGDEILTNKIGLCKVRTRALDYRNVDHDDESYRGKEIIYIFV
jgi:hypothetical protein